MSCNMTHFHRNIKLETFPVFSSLESSRLTQHWEDGRWSTFKQNNLMWPYCMLNYKQNMDFMTCNNIVLSWLHLVHPTSWILNDWPSSPTLFFFLSLSLSLSFSLSLCLSVSLSLSLSLIVYIHSYAYGWRDWGVGRVDGKKDMPKNEDRFLQTIMINYFWKLESSL